MRLVFENSTEKRVAEFSPCQRYRYLLEIVWDPAAPLMQVIGLNPSTADHVKDDPTVRKCKALARKWNYGGLLMTNLFAFRATSPAVMKKQSDPTGDPENFSYICSAARVARIIVAAWGVNGPWLNRADKITSHSWFKNIRAFRLTKHGHPEHPLYLPLSICTIPFNCARANSTA